MLEDLLCHISVKYLDNPFSGCLSTDRFLSVTCFVPQRSGYARFELQADNIPHREEDTIYGNGLLFEVQYRPDIVQGLLANYQKKKIVFNYNRLRELACCRHGRLSYPPK